MKKTFFLISIFMCMLFMTACSGANITSNTRFNPDGSGTRTVTAYVRSNDIENMQGGFEELDQLLEEVSPEGVNLARTMQENKDAIYEFSFSFSDIEEYNKKVSLITGKNHNATWYTDESIFKSDIKFLEEECTYDLVKWATDAFDNSVYSKIVNLFSLYQIGENKVFFNDELVYSESGKEKDPYFEIETAPVCNNISMYTSFDRKKQLKKTLILTFDKEKENFANLNTDEAKNMLDSYSTKFKIDLANCKIVLELDNEEEIREFFQKADDNYKDENFEYRIDDASIFRYAFTFKECYSLKGFLSQFKLADEYVYNYLSIPDDIEYKKREFYTKATLDTEDGYQKAGKYNYTETYRTDFEALEEVSIEGINVSLRIEDKNKGELVTTFKVNPNGCEIDVSSMREYYQAFNDFISLDKKDDFINIKFKKKINIGMKEELNDNLLEYTKVRGFPFKKSRKLVSNFNIKPYLPVETDTPVNYEFILSKDSNLDTLQIDNTKYVLEKKEENSNHLLLAQYLQDDYYKISVKKDTLEPMKVRMIFKENNQVLWMIIGCVLLVFAVAFFGITIYDLKHEDEESISNNWSKRLKSLKTIGKKK